MQNEPIGLHVFVDDENGGHWERMVGIDHCSASPLDLGFHDWEAPRSSSIPEFSDLTMWDQLSDAAFFRFERSLG